MRNIKEEIKKRVLLIDGAMGSLMQKKGILKKGVCPELLNIDEENSIIEIHKGYIEAGADILTTNSFGANYFKLKEYALEERVYEINKKAAENARKAAGENNFVAGSIGPTGKFIKTEGDLDLEHAIEVFSEQARGLADGGADVLIVETMFDLWELKAAVMGIKSVSDLPIIAHLTYQENARTLTGTDPKSHVITMEGLDVFCVGSNCSLGAKEMVPVIEEIRKNSSVYVSAEPNAGLPVLKDGETIFPMQAEEFGTYIEKLIKSGVNIVGGCCGTDYSHIKQARKIIDKTPKVNFFKEKEFSVASRTKSFFLSEKGFFLIGERLNPTARKKLSKAVIDDDYTLYIDEAQKQEISGADVIDVNVGVPDIDEVKALSRAIGFVQGAIEAPISIDSSEPDAIVEALKITDGKPLVNSVNGKVKTMEKLFPVISKYGAAAIVLLVDEEGIPETLEKREEILQKVLKYAEKYKVPKHNLIVDCLALAAAAEEYGPKLGIQTIEMVSKKYKMATLMGISNVSYGLPLRKYINATFLNLCMGNGLTACIGNPMSPTYMVNLNAAKFLLGMDKGGRDFLNFADGFEEKSKKITTSSKNVIKKVNISVDDLLFNAIIKGNRSKLEENILNVLKDKKPLDIIKNSLIPAIELVGEKYDKQEYYLPQLIAGADVMKEAFEVLKPYIEQDRENDKKIGKIVLATVEGDVHDIGKNIVKLMLENFGFDVVDLGKDVKTDILVEKVIEENPDILGLSALMTTTMVEMENIIKKLKEKNIKVQIIVGGAVLTQDYADRIGADGYSKDAMSAVNLSKELIKNRN